MSTPLLVLIGTERSRSLATSALPDAPVQEPRPAGRVRPRRHGARIITASAAAGSDPYRAGRLLTRATLGPAPPT